jgi:Rrf2 family protein
MRLKTRTEYAYWALVDLAENAGSGRPVTIPEIAGRRNIPERFLLQVMGSLKRAGLVESVRGKAGGYLLGKAATEINFFDVYSAMENSNQELPCATLATSCLKTSSNCSLAKIWIEANEQLRNQLESVSLAEMIEGDKERAAITYHI